MSGGPWFGRAGWRRGAVHLFCLGLVWLAVSGPLGIAASVGTRVEVAEAVVRHTRYLRAVEEAAAPPGWQSPSFALVISDVPAPEPALPSVPSRFVQAEPAPELAPAPAPVIVESLPLPPPAALAPNPRRDAAGAAMRSQVGTLSDAYGVVVLDADGVPAFEHQPGEQFQAASLYKLGVAAEVFRQQKQGRLTLKDPLIISRESLADGDTMFAAGDIGRKITVGEAVDFMITRSSNVAAILLLRKVEQANINQMFASLGLQDTRLLDRPFRNIHGNARNQTTPRDMGRFFWLLLRGKVVDVESSQALIRLLLRQRIDDRLPAALPKGVPIAHKTGNLVGVVHDAGIIYSPAGPLVVVAMSQDAPSEDEATATIALLARIAYDGYAGDASAPLADEFARP
jgi:beta-lactamase class A